MDPKKQRRPSSECSSSRASWKFDTLFSQGVIKHGDVLTYQVSTTAKGRDQKTEAHLQVGVRSFSPDIHQAHPNRSSAHHDVQQSPPVCSPISRSALLKRSRRRRTPRPKACRCPSRHDPTPPNLQHHSPSVRRGVTSGSSADNRLWGICGGS